MTEKDNEKVLIERTVEFVLSHYELGGMPLTPDPVDPDTWWDSVQIRPHNPEDMFPRSRAHFEARVARWKELAVGALLTDDENRFSRIKNTTNALPHAAIIAVVSIAIALVAWTCADLIVDWQIG